MDSTGSVSECQFRRVDREPQFRYLLGSISNEVSTNHVDDGSQCIDCSSLLLGNIYVYISLKTAIIDRATRHSLFAVFSTVAASSLVLFFVLVWRSYSDRRRARLIKPDVEQKSALTNVRQTLIAAGQVLKTRHMRLMLILFIYLGSCSARSRSR